MMKILRPIARWILRDELSLLRGEAAIARRFFNNWRNACWLWERYALHLESKHGLEETFSDFFWSLSHDERKNPKPSGYVPGPRKREQ